ncbi:LemA family protein [Thiomicrorhabdus hydrogeniphila]
MEDSSMLMVGVVIFAIVLIYIYNKIVSLKESVKRGWANVVTQERQKGKILPEVIKLLDQYKGHEESVITEVTKLRTMAQQLQEASSHLDAKEIDVKQVESLQRNMGTFLGGIHVVAEAYPQLEMKDVTNRIINEISDQEENVGAAIRIFNSNVEEFNAFITMFPMNIVNSFLNKEKMIDIFSDSEASKNIEYSPNL